MKNENFEIWLEGIPMGKHKDVKSNIVANCGITENIFQNWKKGRTEISVLAKKEINAIALKYSLKEPFTL